MRGWCERLQTLKYRLDDKENSGIGNGNMALGLVMVLLSFDSASTKQRDTNIIYHRRSIKMNLDLLITNEDDFTVEIHSRFMGRPE